MTSKDEETKEVTLGARVTAYDGDYDVRVAIRVKSALQPGEANTQIKCLARAIARAVESTRFADFGPENIKVKISD
jgi:hypothetical protein